MKIKSLTELKFVALRPPIVHGLIRRGEVMSIVAPPKSGATCLAIQLAVAISRGEQWLGFETTKSAARYVNVDPCRDYASMRRVFDVCGERKVPSRECGFFSVVGPVELQMLDSLKAMDADSPASVDVIVVDPVDTIYPAGFKANDNESVTNFYNKLDEFALETGSAIVLIHHATKPFKEHPEDVGAGVDAYSRSADTRVALRKHTTDGRYVFDAATRSFQSSEPFCADFKYPLWSRVENQG